MAELHLDVNLEFDPVLLAMRPDPIRVIAEMSRWMAEERCAEAGATLRHPDPREVIARQAIRPLDGKAVLLVATRWVADGPGEARGTGGGVGG